MMDVLITIPSEWDEERKQEVYEMLKGHSIRTAETLANILRTV